MSRFYYAWADQAATFDPAVHNVEDEEVFSFSIEQKENDFATMDIEIVNPRIGLLNVGRKVWAFLSVQETDGGAITPLFYGRLIGVPSNVFDEVVALKFIARPFDFVARKKALANTLRVLPFWDHVFIAPDSWDDDDVVLESRSAVYHIDRVTHAVTISDIINAEDGNIEFDEDSVFYDSLSISMGTAPLRSVSVISAMPWTQRGTGQVNLTNFIDRGYTQSFNIESIISGWPKTGSKIGDFDVADGDAKEIVATGTIQIPAPDLYPPYITAPKGTIAFSRPLFYYYDGLSYDGAQKVGTTLFGLVMGSAKTNTLLSYDVEREYAEKVVVNITTQTQAIITLTDEEEIGVVQVNANPLSDIGYNGEIPIVDARRRSYITTPRGQQSLRHLTLIGRALLLSRARAVETTFEAAFFEGVAVSLRKSASVQDVRIPGGIAVGKITSYTLSLDGASGTPNFSATIASCVGYGGAYTEEQGDPTWFERDYIADDYQEFENAILLAGTTDVAFTAPTFTPFDDGVDFISGLTPNLYRTGGQGIVTNFAIVNPPEVVSAALTAFLSGGPAGDIFPDGLIIDQSVVDAFVTQYPHEFSLGLRPLKTGPWVNTQIINTTALVAPKQIDLEAGSL